MKTYRPKEPGHIQAQKFRSGQDKGSWPPCVEKHRWKANVYEVRMNDNAPYSYADVAEGDWVVLASSGWRHVLKPLEFEAKYAELEPETAPKPKPEVKPPVVEPPVAAQTVVEAPVVTPKAKQKAKGHAR